MSAHRAHRILWPSAGGLTPHTCRTDWFDGIVLMANQQSLAFDGRGTRFETRHGPPPSVGHIADKCNLGRVMSARSSCSNGPIVLPSGLHCPEFVSLLHLADVVIGVVVVVSAIRSLAIFSPKWPSLLLPPPPPPPIVVAPLLFLLPFPSRAQPTPHIRIISVNKPKRGEKTRREKLAAKH